MKHDQRLAGVLVLLIVGHVTGCARAAEPDPILVELEVAKKAHTEALSNARSALRSALDDAINKVAQSGDLDAVKAAKAEKASFEQSGKLPTSPRLERAAASYEKAQEQAKAAVENAYDQAIKASTKALKIEQAEAIRAELKQFQSRGTVVAAEQERPVTKSKEQQAVDLATLEYEKEVRIAEQARADALEKARKKLRSAYDGAISGAMRRGGGEGLDVANRLNEEKKKLEEGVPDDAVSFGGHRYKLFNEPMTWQMAQAFCEARGGHLVCINSQAENSFIRQLAKSATVWIGASDEAQEGKWRWVSGEAFQFAAWAFPPDNHQGIQHHASSGTKGWDDECAGERHKFICEWKQ